MASLHGKLEGRIVIPSGNWTASLTESGGGGAQTITLTAANTYYWSSAGNDTVDFPARLKALLDAASVAAGNSNTYTVTISAAESGTGKLTIAVDSGTFSLSWTSTDLRDLCGFTGNISSASTSTGGNHAQGLWLPDCPVETPYGLSSSGLPQSHAITTLAPDGTYFATHGSKMVRNEYTWQCVAIAKTVTASESTTGASYETFWLDTVRGEEPWANAGRQVRYYKDCSDDATYKTLNATGVVSPQIQRATPDYDGWWSVRFEGVEN